MPTNYNPSLHDVRVRTWGTTSNKGTGLGNFIEQDLFGGNVGHAAINMKLPVTEETKGWVEKYCYDQTYEEYRATLEDPADIENLTFDVYLRKAKQRIPTSLESNTYQAAKYNVEGVLETSEAVASETHYFEIDFSWWPGGPNPETGEDMPFSLSRTEDDRFFERSAKHFAYSDKWKEYLKPEQRSHTGRLGGQVMDYNPVAIIHQRNLSTEEFDIVKAEMRLGQLELLLDVEDKLHKKLADMTGGTIEGSFALMLHNIGLDKKELVGRYLKENPGELHLAHFQGYLLYRID